jgi:predicted metalloprotease with PDZ domain
LFWFTEGFTDYFAFTLLVLEGMRPFDRFLSTLNDKLRQYAENPARSWPNSRAGREYHRDCDAQALAYLRGMFIALNWNVAIRRATGGKASLTDMVRSLRQNRSVLTASTIAEAAVLFGVKDAASDIVRWIDEGHTIELSSDALGPCAAKVDGRFHVKPRDDNGECTAWFR